MSAPARQVEPVSILLVDDRPNNLMSLKALLQRPEYDLVLAASGPEALALVLRHDFAVILLDVAMPRMDGFETAAIIREREQTKFIPILFITASVYDMEHVFRGYDVGAVDYLRKPIDPHAVRAKVAVFVQLYRQRKQLETQSNLLRAAEVRLRISERKRHELERGRLVRELQENIRTRDDFLAVAAHELKTPMTPLRLQAESLVRELRNAAEPVPKDELLRRVDTIDKAARRLDALVERLLDESQLSVGNLRLELEDVDLVAILREALARVKDDAERAGSAIAFQAPDSVIGRWDPLRLDQAAANLLTNAIKYGASKPIEVKVSQQQGTARFSVRDHGLGIPEEALERIFERFERVAPLRHYSGFGLGLWIVRRVVEAHGGRVTAWSQPNQGSEFVVELPTQPTVAEPSRTLLPTPLEVHP